MEKELKELLEILDEKSDNGDIGMYEDGIKDILSIILHKDMEALKELIDEYK